MSHQPRKNPNPFWHLFSSVRLTVALLIIIAIASVLGTLIPQREEAIDFARSLSPETLRVFTWFSLFDMYHSLWFRLLLALLTLNLIICSIDRFPVSLKRSRTIPSPERKRPFENLPPDQSFQAKITSKDAADHIRAYLRSHYRNLHTKESANMHHHFSEKGAYSHFGVYIVHFSVLLILIGGLIASMIGFEGYVNILEGETVDFVHGRDFGDHKGHYPLGFEVRCDAFSVDFYENGTPKDYRSELTFITDGEEIEKQVLRVNHPVRFRGMTFYQANYGTIPGKKAHLKLVRAGDDQNYQTRAIEIGAPFELPGNEGQFQVVKVTGNFRDMLGPAALMSVVPHGGKEIRFWIFQKWEMIRRQFPKEMLDSPMLNPSAFRPYTFFLDDIEKQYYTGLQVNKAPGVSIVWVGCFLLVLGFIITFFTSHRKIWVQISREKSKTRVKVAGSANKNPVGLQRELNHLTQNLKEVLKEKGNY